MGHGWRYGSAMFTDLAGYHRLTFDEGPIIIVTVGKIKFVLPAKAFKFGNVQGFVCIMYCSFWSFFLKKITYHYGCYGTTTLVT
jgi:hypothetical protein